MRFFSQNAQRVASADAAAAAVAPPAGTPATNVFLADPALASSSTNAMDRWIFAATQGLIAFVRTEMAAYRLYTVVPRLVRFIGNLTNW